MLVGEMGLEPTRLAARDPKSRSSANSDIPPWRASPDPEMGRRANTRNDTKRPVAPSCRAQGACRSNEFYRAHHPGDDIQRSSFMLAPGMELAPSTRANE